MTNGRQMRFVFGLVALILGAVLLAPAASAGVSQAIHFSLDGQVPQAKGNSINGPGIPADCSSWHELYPSFCAPHHQDSYEDDGDGMVSVCDHITLNGVRYHIDWVGPTYHLTCITPGPPTPVVMEPSAPQPGENPICEVWHEVWPNYCQEFHIDSWNDANGNGLLDPCDEIDVQPPQVPEPRIYHIDRISLDIIVSIDPTASPRRTWGDLKRLYYR